VINFRYHVVSLTAVFLALAIGLVVDTTALNGPVADSLRDQVIVLGQQNQELRDRVNHLNNDVEQREEFATRLAPVVLANRLSGDRVLVVSVPSGQEYVDSVVEMLGIAGATVTGQVEFKDRFTDPVRNDELLDLAHTSQPPSVSGPLPTNSNGVESSAALLAAVLLDRSPAASADDTRAVLGAYRDAGYLGFPKDIAGPAQAVVVVSGPPVTDKEAAGKNAAVVTLVDQLDKAGSVVVAASADAGDGNVVAELRGDPKLAKTISTVDNVSTPQGRLVTAWAVADQIAGKVGHYGIGAGAALLPKTSQ
jgi:Copper transport outer membrane protein, MctB